MLLARAVELQDSVLQWLAPYDPTQLYRQALPVEEIGTGRWFLDGPFAKWYSESSSAVLWLKGKRMLSTISCFQVYIDMISGLRQNHTYVSRYFAIKIEGDYSDIFYQGSFNQNVPSQSVQRRQNRIFLLLLHGPKITKPSKHARIISCSAV